MNEKGINALILVFLFLLLIAIAVQTIMYFFTPANIVFRLILVLVIFTTVRNFLGPGVPSLIISGVLIYFLAIKWVYIFSSVYVLFILWTFGFFSVILWGTVNVRSVLGGQH